MKVLRRIILIFGILAVLGMFFSFGIMIQNLGRNWEWALTFGLIGAGCVILFVGLAFALKFIKNKATKLESHVECGNDELNENS